VTHVDGVLLAEQGLNGLEFGIMLFLMAAGLTLVFGIMNVVNMAHGSLYMVGAYLSAWVFATTGSFVAAVVGAILGTIAVGLVIEIGIFRDLYRGDHLDQVLATFGITLIANEMVRYIWGPQALFAAVPSFLGGQVQIFPGLSYSAYRLAIILVGLAVGAGLYILILRTNIGRLIRASASNRTMAAALGVNDTLLYTVVFAIGAALAALSGLMAGPIFAVLPGMGDNVLILALVVIVIGGIGSIRGAFIGALLIGIIDTLGRAFLRPVLATFLARTAADNAAPALASMLIYILMAAVLFFRPQGLFPVRTR
jgi:branched-chain amino acid transport system permease protein